ncbi:hypothetical protein MAPG_00178 [Magnaporthiopsis poae ATCC 64411]|uniref:Uncharacterized protein n=1 Tax=Magnaporthiopsis poae (strain ATCC 64411 / 73-15) TaxID=644358 RepID=A0A0C4DKB2_MAGP6|nr:hypothetical protein MAPG_00178 [Magnaporthiopsis poae ATCC 64411]
MKAIVFAAALITFFPRALGQKHPQAVLRGYCRRTKTPPGRHECVIASTQVNWGPFPCPTPGEVWKAGGDDSLVYRGIRSPVSTGPDSWCEFVGGECTFITNEPKNPTYADCAAYLGRSGPVHELFIPPAVEDNPEAELMASLQTNGRPPNGINNPQGNGNNQQGKGNGQQGKANGQQGKGNSQPEQEKGNTPQTKKNGRRGNMRRGNRI